MGIDALKPIIDDFAPLYHVRSDAPPILLLTGNRELELLGRYEENAYLMRMLKLSGHKEVEHLEFDGYGHGISIPAMPVLLRKSQPINRKNKVFILIIKKLFYWCWYVFEEYDLTLLLPWDYS